MYCKIRIKKVNVEKYDRDIFIRTIYQGWFALHHIYISLTYMLSQRYIYIHIYISVDLPVVEGKPVTLMMVSMTMLLTMTPYIIGEITSTNSGSRHDHEQHQQRHQSNSSYQSYKLCLKKIVVKVYWNWFRGKKINKKILNSTYSQII